MEGTYSPLVRQFSAIDGLQTPYTLMYALETAGDGTACRLSLYRTGANPCAESMSVNAEPECCYRMLRFLYENAVQPEIWRDTIAELAGAAAAYERNGMLSG